VIERWNGVRRAWARCGACVAAALALAGCAGHGRQPAATGVALAPAVRANADVAKVYDLADARSFEDAARGLIAAPSGQVRDAAGRVIWDFDGFAFVEGAAPPTVNPSLWRMARLNNNAGLFKVADGIWQLRGFDLANITLVEGRTGWIVVDALTARETAAAAMAFARRHLGDRQVSAIVFTHSHIDHFGGALGVVGAEEAAARGLPVVAPAGFIEEATSENVLMGTAMGRRATYMYGSLLPRSAVGAVDTGLGKAVAIGQVGILPPNVLIEKEREEVTLDGVRFVFHNVPGSEAPAELTFYLPERKAYGGAETLSHTMHNLYTLRGAKVRDALRWSNYLDDALAHAAQAEVYFGQHHWPVWGRQRIAEFIAKQRDVYRYLHDQTVRMMNAGLTAPEIAESVRLPKSLDGFLSVHGYYGTVRHNVRAIYQHYLGWFDANPANLDALPPVEHAKRFVSLAGGADKAVAAARAAFDAGDYRWAAEVLKHVVYAEPEHEAARELLASAFEQMGYVAESAPWRNFYLTGAFELRNGKAGTGITNDTVFDLLRHTPIERFLEAMAASLDGPRAEDSSLRVNLVFSDLKTSYVLWIENAVLHFRRAPPAPDANATLTLTKPFFLRMLTGGAGARDLLLSDETRIEGSRIDLARFFALLDRAPGTFEIVTRGR
jgi:alkyl sulfatase BDS1-like metallo-beta-lactamase superfamily hydrolase